MRNFTAASVILGTQNGETSFDVCQKFHRDRLINRRYLKKYDIWRTYNHQNLGNCTS